MNKTDDRRDGPPDPVSAPGGYEERFVIVPLTVLCDEDGVVMFTSIEYGVLRDQLRASESTTTYCVLSDCALDPDLVLRLGADGFLVFTPETPILHHVHRHTDGSVHAVAALAEHIGGCEPTLGWAELFRRWREMGVLVISREWLAEGVRMAA